MKKLLTVIIALLVFHSISLADIWTDTTITENTTWTKNNASGDGVWIVDTPNDTLIVKPGVTLTIEPGVTVKFHGDVLFLVYGSLIAEGTAQDSIIFTMDDAAGSATEWSGIKLLPDSSLYFSKLAYCRIEKGDADINVPGTGTHEENGGAIYVGAKADTNTQISHCTIQNNRAVESGGGIYVVGSPKIELNLIRYNLAAQFGGGIGVRGKTLSSLSAPILKNNIIVHNQANGLGGGGIGAIANTNITMINDLVYDNQSATGSGGGIFLYNSSCFLTGKNLIVRNNLANSDNQIHGVATISNSNIEGGYTGTANIDSDPQFADPQNDDFHFEANSPIVDAGDNTDAPSVDFDGQARPFDGDRDGNAVVDMGPYEYQNTAPTITSTPVTNATEDQLYTYQVVAEDPDAEEVLSYSLIEGPAWLSMDSQTGLLSGTPQTNNDAGDHPVTVQVADLNNATDTQSFTLTVTAVNDAPVVSDIPNQTIDEGQTFATINLDDYVSDEDNSAAEMTWSYSGNLQLIVSIDENHVATIQTPDADWYGSETITFTATDPEGLSDSDQAIFTVNNINDAPQVSDIPDQTIDEGQSFTQINLDDYVTDIDNVESDLTWTYSGNTDLTVVIDQNHIATISTPDENWNGSETITFTATDPGGLSDSDPATFTVNAVNDAPVVSDIPDQTINEGESFVSIPLDDYVTDVDNAKSELTWTYSGNQDLTVVISADHIATISIPDENWFGSEAITFRATDPEGAWDEDVATFTVNNVNDAPVAADDQVTTPEDNPVTIHVLNNDSDIDGDQLTIIDVSVPANGTATIQNDTVIVYTPQQDWYGDDSFTYTIDDGNGATAQASVTVTVTAVNDTPVVADIPDQVVNEGETFTDINLDDYVSDVDNADSEISWTYTGNQELQVSISADRVAHITIPNANWNGSETITFIASDPAGLSDQDSAVFTVQPVNDPPVASDDNAMTNEDQSVQISVLENDSDADNDQLSVSQVFGFSHGNVEIVGDTLINYQPSANYYGQDQFQYVVSDGKGGLDTATVFLTIQPVNDAPVISSLGEQKTTEGNPFDPVQLDDFVNDVDDPDSLIQWQASQTVHISITISEKRVLSAQPVDENWFGSEWVVLTATDTSGLFDQDSVLFTVQPVNDVPVAVNDTVLVMEDSSLVIYPLSNDSDIDGDSLQVSLIDSVKHGVIVLQDNHLNYQPVANFYGMDSLTYLVDDGNGGRDTALVLITVQAVNDAPVLTQIENQTIMEGSSFDPIALDQFVNDVDDPDSLLNWSVKGQKDLMATITPQRFLFVEPPSSEWNGSELLTLTVQDTAGLSDSVQVLFTVLAVNDTVDIQPLPALTFKEDDSLYYAKTNWYPLVEDKDNPDSTLNFSLTAGKFVQVQTKAEGFLLKAPANWFGNDTLLLSVDDGLAGSSANVYVTVKPVNDPPEIRNLPEEITFDNDTTYTLTMNEFAFDVDTPDSLLSWNFMVSNDSLKFAYDQESSVLSLSAPDFSGTVLLTCILKDDSAATVKDTIKVVVNAPTGLQDDHFAQVPDKLELQQNYPNPFNPVTKIRFGLPKAEKVTITVYDILGKKVATVFDGFKPAGYHVVSFNATSLSSGIYFYRLTTESGRTFIKKMVVMK